MLETKIEELTIAINKLTEVILADVKQDVPALARMVETFADEVEAVKESVVEDAPPWVDSIDFDEFKGKCLDFVRSPKVGKDKVKAVLKDFGADKASDIKDGDRAKVLATLEAI